VSLVNIALWAAGVALIVLAALRVKGPMARRRALDETTANLQRYDEWRGNRLRPEPGERTGADEMRDELSRQVRLWGAVGAAGIGCLVLGFLVR